MKRRIPLPKGKWVEKVLVTHYCVGLATAEALRAAAAALHGCPPSSTERALRALKEAGLVEVRTRLKGPWRSSPRGRKTEILVLTPAGQKAAAGAAEATPGARRKGPGRYRRTAAALKERHDLLLAWYLAALCRSSRAAGDVSRFGWAPERAGGEAGAVRALGRFASGCLKPDGFVTLRADDPKTGRVRRRHVLIEADTGTQHRGVVAGKLGHYSNLVSAMTQGRQDPDPFWGLPLVVFVSFDPERSLAVARWMRETVFAPNALRTDSELLRFGIRFEDFFAATNVRWCGGHGALGTAYACPGLRLVRRDAPSVVGRPDPRAVGGLSSMPALMRRLDCDPGRGDAEAEARRHRRLLEGDLRDEAVAPPELAARRGEALRLNAVLRGLRRYGAA